MLNICILRHIVRSCV